ncbi:hypothetical protein BST79_gp147 [Only Syngen Nebraska virus 5]|uniref:hypothetical protein n=1 Tax=Only Syngen Nebraska virus 5 TaxID=1917232 RepID=UPI000901BE83|nr:hypothetical protein BST79_gp147 [Only Syngen Nebraska virus 5]APC25660.1 hypothetical protein [Only Syngen Nebraska virus 5]
MAFFNEIVNITKSVQNAKITEELERDADSLFKFTEKKIKNEIRKQAETGGDFIDFNLVGSVDTNYRWSVEELMFERIAPGFATVQERLYDETKTLQTSGPFEGFEISDFGGNMITISWKTQNDANFPRGGDFPSENNWENVATPVRQPLPEKTCPAAPKKQPTTTHPFSQYWVQPSATAQPGTQPVYHNVLPYTGIFGGCDGGFSQMNGDYTGNEDIGANVEYINQLLEDLFPNLRVNADNKFN